MTRRLRYGGAARSAAVAAVRRIARGLGAARPRHALLTGCPRSGTTAVLAWLARQPGVVANDESRLLFAAHGFLNEVGRFTALQRERRPLLRGLRTLLLEHHAGTGTASTRLIIDKEPLEPVAVPDAAYDRFLHHARELLPRLRILFLVRHPVPTIWSMLNRQWGHSLSTGTLRGFTLDECIAVWKSNAALIAQWRGERRVCVCRLEDLVSEPGRESRHVLDFLGIRGGTAFVPASTRDVRFDETDAARILESTVAERKALGYSATLRS